MQKLAHCSAWTAESLTCTAPCVKTHFSKARLLLWAQPFPHRGVLGTFLRAARRHAQCDWQHLRRTRRCGCMAVVITCEGCGATGVFYCTAAAVLQAPWHIMAAARYWATWTWFLWLRWCALKRSRLPARWRPVKVRDTRCIVSWVF